MLTLDEYKTALEYLVDEQMDVATAAAAANAALRAVLPFVPKRSIATLTGDSVTTSFDLPDDFYWIDAVVDSNGNVLPNLRPHDAEYVGPNYGNAWMLYPEGKITFTTAPDEDVTLYYYAVWGTIPEDLTAQFPTPDYLINALLYYGAAYYLVPGSVSSAEIRQYATKIDSGNPEDNPVGKQVQFMLGMFENEIRRYASSSLRVGL